MSETENDKVELVRLTNLGNLALENIVNMDKKYEVNAKQKRQQMAKLWGGEKELDYFKSVFSWYHPPAKPSILTDSIAITREEGEYFINHLCSHTKIKVNETQAEALRGYEEKGLTKTTSMKDLPYSLFDTIRDDFEFNPLKEVHGVTVELTGLCNAKCLHCYRGGSNGSEPGLPADEIKKALAPMIMAGIKHICFTGGEPTLRRKALLEIIEWAGNYMALKEVPLEEKLAYRYGTPNPTVEDILKTSRYVEMRQELMRQLKMSRDELIAGDWNICNENTEKDVDNLVRNNAKSSLEYAMKSDTYRIDGISVLSNGSFENPEQFIDELQRYGNVDMQCSVDSFNGHRLNKNRGIKGLFGKLKELVKVAKKKKFEIYLTGHNIGGAKTRREEQNSRFFEHSVPTKVLEGMINIGSAAKANFPSRHNRETPSTFGELSHLKSDKDGWCDGFTEPGTIIIRPTGVVGNCLQSYATPEQFGSLRVQTMAQIVNNIQNTRVYKMFKDGRIERYQHEIDISLFPEKFSRSCEPVIITLAYGVTKERLMEQGMKEEEAQKTANEDVARKYGYQKEGEQK